MKTHRKLIYLPSLFLLLTLVACGGGGGGDGSNNTYNTNGDIKVTAKAPTDPVTITDSNSGKVADESVNSFDSLSGGSSNTSNAGILNIEQSRKININDLVNTVTTTYQQQISGTLAAAAISCVTGSGTKPDSFDSFPFTITWNNCYDGTDTINGSVTISGSGNFDTGFTGSFAFNNFTYKSSTDNYGLHGVMNISFSVSGPTTTGTVSSTILQITTGADTTDVTNINMTFTEVDFGDESLSVNYTVNSTRFGGSVKLSTVSQIKTRFGNDYPYSGQVLIEGASGTKIRVTANNDTPSSPIAVTVEVDTDGLGYSTTKQMSWTEFDKGGII